MSRLCSGNAVRAIPQTDARQKMLHAAAKQKRPFGAKDLLCTVPEPTTVILLEFNTCMNVRGMFKHVFKCSLLEWWKSSLHTQVVFYYSSWTLARARKTMRNATEKTVWPLFSRANPGHTGTSGENRFSCIHVITAMPSPLLCGIQPTSACQFSGKSSHWISCKLDII